MKNFILHINPQKADILPFAKTVLDKLDSAGAHVMLTRETDRMLGTEGRYQAINVENELLPDRILIIMGGDGTILRLAKYAAAADVPILGINMGNLGFLSEIEPEEICLLDRVISGDYDIEQRMMLDAELYRNGEKIIDASALNEIILTKEKIGNVVEISVKSDGLPIIKYSGDGVIFSTPTGSTAYSMSAGGPIVEPYIKNTIITPICAHELHAHSIVMSADHKFCATVRCGGNRNALVSVDGAKEIEMMSGETLNISRSKYTTSLIILNKKSFNDRINSKFSKV